MSVKIGLVLLIAVSSPCCFAANPATYNRELQELRYLVSKGSYDRALVIANQLIKQQPKLAEAYLLRAQCAAVSAGTPQDAINDLNTAGSLDPNLPGLYDAMAGAFAEAGKADLSVKWYTEAIRRTPTEKNLYHKRSIAYGVMKKYDLAIADMNAYLKLNPSKSIGYVWRAGTYEQAGQVQRALDDYAKAIALEPTKYEYYFTRASLYKKLGQWDNAIGDLTSMLKINPMDEDLLMMRGGLLARQKRYDLAIKDYNSAIEMTGDFSSRPYEARANVYELMGKADLAAKDRNTAKALAKKAEDEMQDK